MKYYIPNSSINIESILSTESISPVSYYAERPFGSKFFQRIEGVNLDSYLYLFSKVPLFTISDAEAEQYSIAIEIDDDAQLKKLGAETVYDEEDLSIRSCSKTIVLTPWNCRIIYFDERAYRQARSAIESSRNSKIGLRYPWVYCEDGILLEDLVEKINEDLPDNGPNDMSFNVEKGAIWGYILGSSRSIPKSAAKLLSISNRMRNIASNAISNSGECGRAFYEELKELDKAYREIADKETNEQWGQLCSHEEKIILEKFQVLSEALNKFLRNRHLSLTPDIPFSNDSKDAWISYRDALNAYTEAYVNKERQGSSSIFWNEISFFDGHFSLNNYELINCILRKICQGELNKEQIRINRESAMKVVLSDVSTILQKRFGQEVWNQHPEERLYINQLFKNISDFEPFDLNSIDNDELKAIAAFLLKGEDYDALIRYLEDNSAADYRLVLCLWGALEGYASIHKKLLSSVLSAENVCQVNILLGIQEMSMPFPTEVHVPKSYGFSRARIQGGGEHVLGVSVSNNDSEPSMQERRPLDEKISDSKQEEAFNRFFTAFVQQCKAAEKDRLMYHRLFINSSGINQEFYDAIVTEGSLKKGKRTPKNVLQYIEKMIKQDDPIKKVRNSISYHEDTSSLYHDKTPSTGVFLNDLEFLSNNSEFRSIVSSVSKNWDKDLSWFIDAHNPESGKQYYQGKPTDNKTVIDQFCRLKEGIYRKAKDFLFRTYHING